MPRSAAPTTIYQLKLTLLDTQPVVWRRLQVPGDVTLARLHHVFQVVMGWQESHLHQFLIDGKEYGPTDLDDGIPVVNEQRTRLSQVVPAAPAHSAAVVAAAADTLAPPAPAAAAARDLALALAVRVHLAAPAVAVLAPAAIFSSSRAAR